MIVAPIVPEREPELRQLLYSINNAEGIYDNSNSLVPFHLIDTLHFARFVILEDNTREDLLAYGEKLAPSGRSLALLCDCDGSVDVFLRQLTGRSHDGLLKIFSCCLKGPTSRNLHSWLESHNIKSSASYVNWIGRTVVQVREEQQLYRALDSHLDKLTQKLSLRELWSSLRNYSESECKSGHIRLTPEAPTPMAWRISNLAHCIGVPILFLMLLPLVFLYLPLFLIQLRIQEKTDPVVAPRPTEDHARELASIEDHVLTNQFSAYGNLKPGIFRRLLIAVVFMAIDYTARHIYKRGFLARVVTIHFARWVFLDGQTRAFFASNYDGSLEAYMGDFINKVAWGLNVVFSNGLGYPRTNWLIKQGAKEELTFKDYLRRHQLPTQVWYNATPDLTACDMERNARIRAGLEKPWLSDADLKQWVSLF